MLYNNIIITTHNLKNIYLELRHKRVDKIELKTTNYTNNFTTQNTIKHRFPRKKK